MKFVKGLLFLFIAMLPLSVAASDVQQISIGDNIFDETQCTTQEYSFDAVAGEYFLVSVTECPEAPSCGTNDGFNPCVRLADPLRDMCLSDTLPGSTAEFRFTATEDAERLLSVYDGGGNKSGWFNLFVQSLTDPRGYARVELGEDISGVVSQCGEVDSYVFSGFSGEIATFNFESTDGSAVCGRYQLYDPDGNLLFTTIEQDLPRVQGIPVEGMSWEISMDGDYLLLISSCNIATGEYAMHTEVFRSTTTTSTTSTSTSSTTTTSTSLSTTTTATSTTTTTIGEPPCVACSDHNREKAVTATDALIVLFTSVDIDVDIYCAPGCPEPCGDHDSTNGVRATDALIVLRRAVCLLPCDGMCNY